MEDIKDEWWCREFSSSELPGKIDYLSRDGSTAVEVLKSSPGSRGLYAALMGLAIFLSQNPQVRRGCLVVWKSRLSLERVKEEWANALRAFEEPVAQRLALVYFDHDQTWIDPTDAYYERIASAFRSAAEENRDRHDLNITVRRRPGQKFYEVLKVLLIRWLQEEGPIPLGKLADEVGCSHPTVKNALERDSLRNTIYYTSSRSVELKAFPHIAWKELLALTHEIRNTFRFRDRTGNKPDPESLLRRVERHGNTSIGLSGVFAARHWHPDFDLHGTPRLDIVYHAPNGRADLQFVKQVDPALSLDNSSESSPALVIHVIERATSQFVSRTNEPLPWADPVETVLDLYDMSLTVQANQLLTHLRPEARLA
jgi:hypothetical protein